MNFNNAEHDADHGSSHEATSHGDTGHEAESVRDAVAGFFGQDMAEQVSSGALSESALRSLEQLVGSIDASRERLTSVGHADAVKRSAAGNSGEVQRYIAFDLGSTRYAVAMENVLEVERLPSVTPIPNVPEWIDGLSNLRGEIISVVDLRRYFQMDDNDSDRTRRMLVVKSLEADVTTSLVVDRVAGIRNIATGTIQPPTSAVASAGAEFITGTSEPGGELLVILDLEALLQCDAMQQFNALAV